MNAPDLHTDAVEARPGGIRAAWRWLRSDPKRIAMMILGLAILSHIVVLMIMSRGWFFTNDDWDYLTRDGVGDLFQPHAGHITVWLAGIGLVVKPIGRLDYWPVYPAVIAILWSLVPIAAYWAWRRLGADAIPSAIGAAVLAWIATAAYMQFGHVSTVFTFVTLILVVPIDEKRVALKHVAAAFGLSLVAVLAGSAGVTVTTARLVMSLVYRKWTGVLSTVPALIIYYLIRSAVVTGSTDISFGVGDIPKILEIVFRAVGEGLRALFFLPAGFETLSGALLLVVAIVVLIRARFSFRVTTWIASGAIFVFVVAVMRFLNVPWRMETLLSGHKTMAAISPVRWANVVVILLIVASLPMVAAWAKGTKVRWHVTATVGAVILFVAMSMAQTVLTYGRISDLSVKRASSVETIAQMVNDGEPYVNPRAEIGRNGKFFTVGALEEFADEGLIEGLLGSEIFTVRQFDPVDEAYTRGFMRFTTFRPGKVSTWTEVGLPGVDGCLPADENLVLEISSAVVMLLQLSEDDFESGWAELTWTDEFGFGRKSLVAADFDEDGSVDVGTAAVLEGSPPARVTVTGPDLTVCFRSR